MSPALARIPDLLVHLDGSRDDGARLGAASAIARTFESHLTAIYTNLIPHITMMTEFDAAAAIAEFVAAARQSGDRAAAALAGEIAGLGLRSDFRRVDGTGGEIAAIVTEEARWNDLFVALRPLSATREERWNELVEKVLFDSGRALLLVPDDYVPGGTFTRPLVAWKPAREAARAISAAMPFLKRAERVNVALADPFTGHRGEWIEPGADIARHLGHAGIEPHIVNLTSGEHDTGELLLRSARDQDCDLIVLGAYGHSRFREWALGGVTRFMLTYAPVPLLIAH
jgi:nucleotide-binding universal stress UspA family protein